jgi:hypothetical protein
MNGATLGKNPRRTGVPATKRGIPNPAYAEAVEGIPTASRLAMAGVDLLIGGDERTGRRYVMQDNPLDRALKRGVISGSQHSALEKFRHHWFHAGLSPSVGSIDFDRVFSSDPGNASGMAKSENQAFHRGKYREAVREIGAHASAIVERVVCQGHSFDEAGTKMGWASPYRARKGARELLSGAATKLASLWGIG